MATGTSELLLPGQFKGSIDIESYITHLNFVAQLQKRSSTETNDGNQVEKDEHPQFGTSTPETSKFFSTPLQQTRKKRVMAQQSNLSKHKILRNQSCSVDGRMQNPGEKLMKFLGDLQFLAMKAYLEASNEIRYFLVVRGFLNGIHNSQNRLLLRKSLVDAEFIIESVQKN